MMKSLLLVSIAVLLCAAVVVSGEDNSMSSEAIEFTDSLSLLESSVSAAPKKAPAGYPLDRLVKELKASAKAIQSQKKLKGKAKEQALKVNRAKFLAKMTQKCKALPKKSAVDKVVKKGCSERLACEAKKDAKKKKSSGKLVSFKKLKKSFAKKVKKMKRKLKNVKKAAKKMVKKLKKKVKKAVKKTLKATKLYKGAKKLVRLAKKTGKGYKRAKKVLKKALKAKKKAKKIAKKAKKAIKKAKKKLIKKLTKKGSVRRLAKKVAKKLVKKILKKKGGAGNVKQLQAKLKKANATIKKLRSRKTAHPMDHPSVLASDVRAISNQVKNLHNKIEHFHELKRVEQSRNSS